MSIEGGVDRYQADFTGPAVDGAGAAARRQPRRGFFAGAKEVNLLECLRHVRHPAVRPRDRFRLVLVSDQADLPDLLVFFQGLLGNFGLAILLLTLLIKLAVLPARQQILSGDEQDEAPAAGNAEDPRALSRRQGAPAAGNHGDVQEGRRQPAGRLPADRDPDPGILLAVQGAVRHDRDAARAVFRLDPRSVGARPDLVRQSVRPHPVRPAASPDDRRVAA